MLERVIKGCQRRDREEQRSELQQSSATVFEFEREQDEAERQEAQRLTSLEEESIHDEGIQLQVHRQALAAALAELAHHENAHAGDSELHCKDSIGECCLAACWLTY